jgi:hypothetical protein
VTHLAPPNNPPPPRAKVAAVSVQPLEPTVLGDGRQAQLGWVRGGARSPAQQYVGDLCLSTVTEPMLFLPISTDDGPLDRALLGEGHYSFVLHAALRGLDGLPVLSHLAYALERRASARWGQVWMILLRRTRDEHDKMFA